MGHISERAVLNYLRECRATVDFSRDTLEVIVNPDDGTMVRIADKVSGGEANFVTGLETDEFEATYGNKGNPVVVNEGNQGIPVGVLVLLQHEYVIYKKKHKAWRLAVIKPETPEYGTPYDCGPGVVYLKNVVAWMEVPKI